MNKTCELNTENPNKSFKIIIIEDDDGLNHLIKKNIKRAGFLTDTANSGEQALQVIKGTPGEILLIDYKLPDISGKELVEKLIKKYGATPNFVVMTGFGDEKIAVEMMKLGAKDYVVKESGFLDLLPEKIKNICNGLQKDRELQKAKKALNETEQVYKVLYETMTEGVIYLNENGEIISANPAALKILGLSNDNITGVSSMDPRWKAVDENYNEFPGEKHPAMLALKNNKKILNVVMGIFNPQKNDYVWILVNAVPLFENSETKPNRVYTTFMDITERKNTEDAVKESEERLKILFENAPDAIFLKDLNGKFIDGNRAVEQLLGYPREYLLNKTIVDKRFIAEKDIDKAAGILKVNVNGKGSGPHEIDLIHKNGFTITTEVITYPVKIKGTRLILGIAHNITERKIAVNKLKQSEEKYRNIFENIQDTYYEVTLNGIILEVSPSVKYLTKGQFNREELINVQMDSLYKTPEDRNGFLNAIQKTGRVNDYEVILQNKDGSEIICSVSAQIQYDNNKVPEKINGSIRNITDRKRIEAELIKAKEKAEESDRLKSAFLANMSHEIRTPMNGILGFTSLLNEPDVSEEERENYINIIQNSGNRMLETVNDLIDISKIETGQVTINLSNINIKNEVLELLQFFEPEAKKKGLTILISDECKNLDVQIKTDSSKFRSVLSNLIKNALKYTHEGYIKIGCKKSEDSLEFYIEDTGIGISENKINEIFKRFIQVEEGYTRTYEGAGLGLSIAKAYAEILGGKIWVKSELNKGSVFYFSIPFSPVQSSEKPDNPTTEYFVEPNDNKLIILIVEDDPTSKLHLKLLLRKHATELLFAETGNEAVDICKKRTDLDIVLMDIKMPIMNGYQAAREIRKFNKNLVIIAQTAYTMSGDHEKAIASGCNDYIAKPINKKVLLEKIVQYTEKKPEYVRK